MYQGIKTVSFEEAVKVVKSGDRIHLHSVACAPQGLIQALCARGRAGELKDVKIQHLHTEGDAPYSGPEFEGVFNLESYFVGANVRKNTQAGYADYVPVHLSETQKLIRSGIHKVDVAMIQVCPPDNTVMCPWEPPWMPPLPPCKMRKLSSVSSTRACRGHGATPSSNCPT